MDCMNAQEILSSAIGQPSEATPELEAARLHCRSCPTCASFIDGVLSLQAAPVPKAPDGLAERVLEAVALESLATERRRQAIERVEAQRQAEAEAETETDSATDSEAEFVIPLAAAPTPRRDRQSWVVWAGSAAAVLVVMFVVGRAGLAALDGGGGQSSSGSPELADTQADRERKTAAPLAAPEANRYAATTDQALTRAAAASAKYVSHGTRVYEEVKEDSERPEDASFVGYVYTARGETDGEAVTYSAYSSGPVSLYLESTSGVIEYRAVTRRLNGVDYVLTSERQLERYGQLPRLPSRLAPPQGQDGSPTFSAGPTDEAGVTVFVPAGGSAAAGFALPPSATGDGNPDWSWWEPLS